MAPFIRTSCGRESCVTSSRTRKPLIFSAVCALALGAAACGDPDLNTALDPDGPPEVLLVTVSSEADGTFIPVLDDNVPDVATFCASSGRVNELMCGDDARTVMDAVPLDWSVRIVFSELLDPDVEDLVDGDGDGTPDTGTLMNTQPVTLTCGGAAVTYDGFYDPSGNAYTYPPGPSLVIATTQFVRTGTTDCAVSLGGNITDKDGNTPPAVTIPNFGIATMKVAAVDPTDGATGVDPVTAVPVIQFNAPVDETTAAQITVNDGTNDIAITPTASAEDPTVLMLVPDAGMLAENTTYTVTLPATAGITDTLGGELEIAEDLVFAFETGTPAP